MKRVFKTFSKSFIGILVLFFLALGLGFSTKMLLAGWIEPTAPAPNGNTDAPVTVAGGISNGTSLPFKMHVYDANGVATPLLQDFTYKGLSVTNDTLSGIRMSGHISGFQMAKPDGTPMGYLFADDTSGTDHFIMSAQKRLLINSIDEDVLVMPNAGTNKGLSFQFTSLGSVYNPYDSNLAPYQGVILRSNDPTKHSGYMVDALTGNAANGYYIQSGSSYRGGLWWFNNGGGDKIRIDSAGDIEFVAPNTKQVISSIDIKAPAFLYSSDQRLKTDIDNLSKERYLGILDLNAVSYKWKDSGKADIGFIAQDVEKVYPELVHTSSDGFKSVDYIKLIPSMVEMIKMQQKEIDELKNKLK